MSSPAPPRRSPLQRRRGTAHKPLTRSQRIGLLVGIVAFVVPFFIDIPNLAEPGERMLSILLLAIVFWVTEAVPLTATAVLIILLEVLLISTEAFGDPFGANPELADQALTSADYFATLANPVIILFLGGFIIADGAGKFGLDRNIASLMLRPFAGSARGTVAGVMAITSLLSFFMSNTATTATMFAIIIPVLGAIDNPKVRTGITLAIPVSANVGGVATPVSTPANAIAVAALAERGYHMTFIHWLAMALPFIVVMLFAAWLLICVLFIPRGSELTLEMETRWNTNSHAVGYYIIAATTIALWMTEPWHGIAASTVGFFPVVALYCLRIIDGNDIKRLDWPIFWLVAGGIALGSGVGATGLDQWILGSIDWNALTATAVLALLCLVTFLFSNIMSNSASANLMVPIAITLAYSLPDSSIVTVGVAVALSASMGMSLPISTPPNTIAYSTGEVSVKDMAKICGTIGIVSTALVIFVMPNVWSLFGLI